MKRGRFPQRIKRGSFIVTTHVKELAWLPGFAPD